MSVPTTSTYLPLTFVVVGGRGVGKTSVSNMIRINGSHNTEDTSTFLRDTSCTSHKIKGSFHGSELTIIDILSIDFSDEKKLDKSKNIIEELCDIRTIVSLVIYVVEQGRLSASESVNFKLMRTIFRMSPFLLCVTKCEIEEDMDSWWKSHRRGIEKHWKVDETVSICSLSPSNTHNVKFRDLLKHLLPISKEKLNEAIIKCLQKTNTSEKNSEETSVSSLFVNMKSWIS
ncbi:MAG: hypothetical protein Sylvanvirus7_26 [Sylvanvirus sp.]|uniref:AIG1-type G domain-containing protein n=1 Tax=Sylvanvirus sp. TaxID=2487774 RepID=A0A3G5AHU3_9VIRU|nr:MAG: hypothetical protein Sylvanvirus7_26 [Sylvanvirus sp.]